MARPYPTPFNYFGSSRTLARDVELPWTCGIVQGAVREPPVRWAGGRGLPTQRGICTSGIPVAWGYMKNTSQDSRKQRMQLRFYVDPETGLPHIPGHGSNQDEVEDVLRRPGEDRPGHEGSSVAVGRTVVGRYLRVIYVPDAEPDSVFVITAYELTGAPLAAYRRRRRRRR